MTKKYNKKSKKPMIIGGTVTGILVTMLIVFTSPEYHCYNVAEETKKDYIQFLYDGLPDFQKQMIDNGQARITDSPQLPIEEIKNKAYEFCVSQKPNVPATVVLQFESENSTSKTVGNITESTTIIKDEGN